MVGILIFQDLIVVQLMLMTPVLGGEGFDILQLGVKMTKAAAIVAAALLVARWIVPDVLHQVVHVEREGKIHPNPSPEFALKAGDVLLLIGISSVTYAGVPDIAIGDVLGSCVFNMLILTFLDAHYRLTPLSTKAHHGHVLSGAIGILLLGIVAMSLLAGHKMPSLGWIGLYTILFIVIYLSDLLRQ